jgi:tRNA:m4X modification enzyme
VNSEILLDKIRNIYHSLVLPHLKDPYSVDIGEYRDKIIDIVAGKATAFEKIRHAEQDICIVQQMIGSGLVPNCTIDISKGNSSCTLVEMGAGRGMLGLAVKCMYNQSKLVLVERNGVRHKADKALRENQLSFERIRMDIRHCLLSKLPGICSNDVSASLNSSDTTPNDVHCDPIIIIAKHLCGAATDITIRSIMCFKENSSTSTTNQSPSPPQSVIKEDVRGLAIATCCHHACTWADYVGNEWFESVGFTSEEYNIMKQWSGWAHTLKECDNCGNSMSSQSAATSATSTLTEEPGTNDDEEDGETHDLSMLNNVARPNNLTLSEMSVIGKMIKRIFDHGRIVHLHSLGFRAYQIKYCDPSLSPECYMILAINR